MLFLTGKSAHKTLYVSQYRCTTVEKCKVSLTNHHEMVTRVLSKLDSSICIHYYRTRFLNIVRDNRGIEFIGVY
jgi:hypothetical protein